MPSGNFGVVETREEEAKRKVTIFAEVVDPDHQADLDLMLHHGGKEEYVWHLDDPLGHFLLICSVIESKDKYSNADLEKAMTRGSDS